MTRQLYVVTFLVAMSVNFVWEMLQSALFAPMGGWLQATVRCAAASVGDGVIVMIIAAVGGLLFRRRDWFARPGVMGRLFMAMCGITVAIVIERRALSSGRWTYAAAMPLLPGSNIGVVPILQMVVLPPLAFATAAGWVRRR